MSSDDIRPEDIEFFDVPDVEQVDEWIVETYRTETMTKFKKAIVATAMINHFMDKGAKSIHQAAIRASNTLDRDGWKTRTLEEDQKALVKYDDEFGSNFQAIRPGTKGNVLPDDEHWTPKQGGRNRKFADYKTLDALKKALPDGPRVTIVDKAGNEKLHRVANQDEGWDRYVFHEATHEWITEESYKMDVGECDFNKPKDLLDKYPIGYHLNEDGEVTDDAKTFRVKSDVKGYEDVKIMYTWKPAFSMDLVDPETGEAGAYEDECSWVREIVFTRDQVWTMITGFATSIAKLETNLETMYMLEPDQMAGQHTSALDLLDFCKMQLEVIEQMLNNGSIGHIAFDEIVSEVRDHLTKSGDEREQDWDAGLTKLLSEMGNRDDGDQS